MALSLMAAGGTARPEIGLQSRSHRLHRGPDAPDPPERHETPGSCRPSEVKVQFHVVGLVRRCADLHDQLELCGIWPLTR